jgi:hypothetical protein
MPILGQNWKPIDTYNRLLDEVMAVDEAADNAITAYSVNGLWW